MESSTETFHTLCSAVQLQDFIKPASLIKRSQQFGLYSLPAGDRRSPLSGVDKLMPGKNNFYAQMSTATYLVLVLPLESIVARASGDTQATRPRLPHYKGPPLLGLRLPAPWPLGAQQGH